MRPRKPILRIGLVGKYIELEDAYLSVKEALFHAGLAIGRDIQIQWISSENLEKGRGTNQLKSVDGIVVPGGFGYRGIEGKWSLPATPVNIKCRTWAYAWACR